MRVFYSTDHTGFWPVGVCSVVVAEHEDQARDLLRRELIAHKLDPDKQEFTLHEIDTTQIHATILLDGEY